MNTSTSMVVAGIPISKEGLNYLVPTPWWNQFCLLNKSTNEPTTLQIPFLHVVDYVDGFLLDFKDHLLEEIEVKSNYLKFHRLQINLEVHKNLSWTPINPILWKYISKKNKDNNGVITIIEKNKNLDFLDTKQIQIVYCSKAKSEAFVGYVPKSVNLALTVRQIGYQMGFVEVFNSKVAFLDRNPQKSFLFHEMEQYTVQNAPGSSFMAFNLQKVEEQKADENMVLERLLNQSNEAVVGDLNTMQDDSDNLLNQQIHNRTISTGAETPYSFVLSQGFDLDREYRVKELFGTKEPEEIQQMRALAANKINNEKQLVVIPREGEQKIQCYLDKLADQLIQGFMKKKVYKEKQVEEGSID